MDFLVLRFSFCRVQPLLPFYNFLCWCLWVFFHIVGMKFSPDAVFSAVLELFVYFVSMAVFLVWVSSTAFLFVESPGLGFVYPLLFILNVGLTSRWVYLVRFKQFSDITQWTFKRSFFLTLLILLWLSLLGFTFGLAVDTALYLVEFLNRLWFVVLCSVFFISAFLLSVYIWPKLPFTPTQDPNEKKQDMGLKHFLVYLFAFGSWIFFMVHVVVYFLDVLKLV